MSYERNKNAALSGDSLAVVMVVMVDMQERFLRAVPKRAVTKIIEKQKTVIRRCAESNIPLVLIEYRGIDGTIETFTKDISKVPRVITMDKWNDGGFIGPHIDLDVELKALGVDTLFLMGVYAGDCVKKAAYAATRRGYKIATSKDVIANQLSTPPMALLEGLFDVSKGQYAKIGTLYKTVPTIA